MLFGNPVRNRGSEARSPPDDSKRQNQAVQRSRACDVSPMDSQPSRPVVRNRYATTRATELAADY